MKVMFVCTGNICRSAMAEGMLKKITEDKNINIEVYSCGIYAISNDYPTSNTIESLKKYDVDISEFKATNIKDANIEQMDLILCATTEHKRAVGYFFPETKNRVYTMKEYAGIDKNGEDMNIEDPWGYDIEFFENCAKQIEACVNKIYEKLKNNNN